jgi:hypothetical protein
MKVNKTLMVYLTRKFTSRINLVFAIGFILTLASAYGDYTTKRMKDPTLPWYAMFLKVQGQSSWENATPFQTK